MTDGKRMMLATWMNCEHGSTVNHSTGGPHLSGGEQWEDIHESAICTECGREVEFVRMFEGGVMITKEVAITLLQNETVLAPGVLIMNYEYGKFDPPPGMENQWIAITSDDLETVAHDEYKSFALWDTRSGNTSSAIKIHFGLTPTDPDMAHTNAVAIWVILAPRGDMPVWCPIDDSNTEATNFVFEDADLEDVRAFVDPYLKWAHKAGYEVSIDPALGELTQDHLGIKNIH